MTKLFRTIVALSAFLSTVAPVNAQKPQESLFSSAWRAMAASDAQAALALITQNHPGASPELNDKPFQQHLATARRHVGERLPLVTDFGGYTALMNGLAADFRDGHIWSSAIVKWGVVEWAGIVPVRRGDHWLVGVQQPDPGEADLTGAEIVSCDGIAFDTLARDQISLFKGDPAIEANLIDGAGSLLIDFHNPYLKRPVSCTFLKGGRAITTHLSWRQQLPERIASMLAKRAQPPAEPGVAPFAGGYWIGLPTLEEQAATVVKAAQAEQAAIRTTPMVVVDLRGNGGGNSAYADDLAKVLVGESALSDLVQERVSCSGDFWRATPFTFDAVRSAMADAQKSGDTESVEFWKPVVNGIANAVTMHHAFWPDLPPCAAKTIAIDQSKISAPPTSSALHGRLIIVTDRSCFSSCLIAVNLFRRLGALQVGQTTNMSTRYMEVHEQLLPSGLRTFSTLMKVAVGLSDYGPYKPDIIYPADLSDTSALKEWVAKLH